MYRFVIFGLIAIGMIVATCDAQAVTETQKKITPKALPNQGKKRNLLNELIKIYTNIFKYI